MAALPPGDVGRQVARLGQRVSFDHAAVTEAVTDALTQLVWQGRPGRSRAATLPSSLDFPAAGPPVTAALAEKGLLAPEGDAPSRTQCRPEWFRAAPGSIEPVRRPAGLA
jgi:hypothetical protein